MATQQGRGERKRPIIVLGLTTPWAAVETAETAVLADITPILTILLTVEAVEEVVLEVVLEAVEEAVAGVAVLLQPVEEDVAPQVPGVAPVLAVEHAAINHANTPSMITSTPWRTITSKLS